MTTKRHLVGLLGIVAAATTLGAVALPAVAHAQQQAEPTYPRGASNGFFGALRTPVFFDAPLSQQFELSMSGGVDYARRLEGGLKIVTTCRPHNCMDKSAAVLDASNRLVGAGMLGSQCRNRGNGVPPCDFAPTAFVFVKKGAQADAVQKLLLEWARSQLVASKTLDDTPNPNRQVRVVSVG